MGSRDFESGSSNRMASASTGWATGLTTNGVTLAAYCTVESLPGAGTYRTMISLTSATAARNLYLGLAGGAGDALSMVVGATQIDFGAGSGLVPTADGRWYIFASSHATGTTAPIGYMFDVAAQTMVTATAGATTGNRTAAAVNLNLGAGLGAADFWDGRIAYAAAFDRVLTLGQVLQLQYRNQWAFLNEASPNGADCDLTWRTNTMGLDHKNPRIGLTTGTAATFTGDSPPWFC